MKKLFIVLTIFASACSLEDRTGPMGPEGAPGRPGSSCSVEPVSNGAVITCDDGTSAVIVNGTDGQDAPPTAYSVVELIDPCGDEPNAFDEVLLRLANGQLMAHYSSDGLQFLTLLSPGNYVTTDSQKCHFTIDSDMNVSW